MLLNVQMLRALAAYLVVFVHLETLLASLGLEPFGYGGVDIFFVISGFIMVHTSRTAMPSPGSFAINRVSRIVPIYWILTLVVFVAALIAPTLFQATRADAEELFKSLFFVPFEKSNGLIQPMLFVGWTLNYEMFFYALFALGLATRNLVQACALVGGVLIVLVVAGMVHRAPEDSAAFRFYSNPIILEFGLGMAVGLAAPYLPDRISRRAGLIAAAFGAVCLGVVVTAPILFPDVSTLIACGVPATGVLAAALIAERAGLRVRHPTVLRLGDASYALYLIHPFVTEAAQLAAGRLGVMGFGAFLTILATLAAVGVAAVLTHRYVERPASQLTRTALRSLSARLQRSGPIL